MAENGFEPLELNDVLHDPSIVTVRALEVDLIAENVVIRLPDGTTTTMARILDVKNPCPCKGETSRLVYYGSHEKRVCKWCYELCLLFGVWKERPYLLPLFGSGSLKGSGFDGYNLTMRNRGSSWEKP